MMDITYFHKKNNKKSHQRIKLLIYTMLLLLPLGACLSDPVIFTATERSINLNEASEALVVYILDNDIYRVNIDGTNKARITNTPDIEKKRIAFSPNKQKIAYYSNGEIIVISMDGAELERFQLSFISIPRKIQWAFNNETIFVLSRWDIIQLGLQIEIPPIDFSPYDQVPTRVEVTSFSINKNYDLLYTYFFQAFSFSDWRYDTELNINNNSPELVWETSDVFIHAPVLCEIAPDTNWAIIGDHTYNQSITAGSMRLVQYFGDSLKIIDGWSEFPGDYYFDVHFSPDYNYIVTSESTGSSRAGILVYGFDEIFGDLYLVRELAVYNGETDADELVLEFDIK